MDHSLTSESEEAALSVDSPLTSDGDNLGGSSSGGTALKKGPWTSAEDAILVDYVKKHGEGNWNAVQKHSGLLRCGKSCRLRWANHLRPNLKKGAFTLEEERLIVELHARMGNKWARMAAHMPGRTDNEIKNYWNTRIKRRHRAGLPLYPPELCIQAQPENHYSPEIYGGDQRCQSILQNSGYKTPDAMFETLNSLPFTPEFSDYSSNGSLVNGFSSPQFCNFIPQTIGSQRHAQEQDESMSDYGADAPTEAPRFDRAQKYSCENNKLQSFGLCFSYTPDHTEKLLLPGVNHGSNFMSNDTFSASKPFLGAEKSELPSLQYEDTYLGVWDPPPESLDSLVRSPQSRPLPSWRASPRSSGLLEDLLYEAKALCKSGNQLSDKSAISPGGTPDGSALKTCSMEFKGYLDPTSPSDNSMESIFNGPTDGIGTSVEEKIPGWNANSEVDKSWVRRGQRKLDFSRPDALLGSCWLQERTPCSEQRGYINDITATFLVDDLGCESKSMAYGTSASASNSGIASCIWNNMPAACQISDFP